jgi:AcrR family transcriptional regulator
MDVPSSETVSKKFVSSGMKITKRSKPARGRPRSFDADEALDRALLVFWEKGYEGASLADLVEAMGINRPSLYAAFGNKEALFKKALDRYTSGPASHVLRALDLPAARAAIEAVLRGAVDLATDPKNPRGCLMVQGAPACGSSADPIRRELNAKRATAEVAIRRRLERAIREGDLARDASAADLARWVSTLLRGLAVEASSGATRAQLQRVVDTAMHAWP